METVKLYDEHPYDTTFHATIQDIQMIRIQRLFLIRHYSFLKKEDNVLIAEQLMVMRLLMFRYQKALLNIS